MAGYKLEKEERAQQGVEVPERRGARRFSVGWSVIVKGTDSAGMDFDETGELKNLSSSGAFLYLPRRLNVGATIDVCIKLPFQKENWMKYQAEVVRVEDSQFRVGIGMRFSAVWPTFQSR